MHRTIEKFHEKYFEILEDYFGVHLKHMKKKGQDLEKAVNESMKAYDEVTAGSVANTFMEETIKLDWQGLQAGIREQGGTKAVHATTTWGLPDAIKRISLYADTCIIYRIVHHPSTVTFERWHPFARLGYLMANSLSLLQMKEIFFADVAPPIAILNIPPIATNPDKRKIWKELREQDGLRIFSKLFGVKASSDEEIEKYVAEHKDMDSLFRNLKKINPFTDSEDYDFRKQVAQMMQAVRYVRHGDPHALSTSKDPSFLLGAIRHALFSSPAQISSQLISCGSLRGQPIIYNREDWCILCWKFSEDSRLLSKKAGFTMTPKDFLLVNALNLDNFKWLGNVPIDGIVRMREEGELQEMRDLLGKGIEEIENVSDEEFMEVSKQVSHNLHQTFKQHKSKVKGLDEKFRRKYLLDVATLTVGGSIGVVSSVFPPLAILAGIIGVGSIKDLLSSVSAKRSKMEELRRKPVGLLFEAYQDKTRKTP